MLWKIKGWHWFAHWPGNTVIFSCATCARSNGRQTAYRMRTETDPPEVRLLRGIGGESFSFPMVDNLTVQIGWDWKLHIARTATLCCQRGLYTRERWCDATSLKPREPMVFKAGHRNEPLSQQDKLATTCPHQTRQEEECHLIRNICFLILCLPIRPSFLTSS